MTTTRPEESDSEIVIPLLSNIMEDWVAMTTTEPPSQHPKVTISAHQSMTGSLIITCAITNHLKFKGKPPFNLTIWHAGEPLVTKQGIETVRYSISHVSGKVTCGLAGPSLSCLPPGDDRLKQAVLKTQGVSVFGTTKEAVDFLIVLFALELSSCIMLMAWNFTLMLEHFRIIVQRKAFRVAQFREENEMNQFSY